MKKNVGHFAASWVIGLLSQFVFSEVEAQTISQVNVLPGHPSSQLIYQASSNDYASFPSGLAFDIVVGGSTEKKVITQWQLNQDSSTSTFVPLRSQSTNGLVFAAAESAPAVGLVSAIKRRNGTILALPYRPTAAFSYYTSTNDGNNWDLHSDGTTDGGVLFHRGILEENDGTLYAVGYNGVDAKLYKSINGGTTWTLQTYITHAALDGRNYPEPNIARCVDGSWLVVVRVQTTNSPANNYDVAATYLPMRFCRSFNKGVTWTPPALLPGLTNALGVDPQLVLMPNGILALSWGQPDPTDTVNHPGRSCHLAFSPDGKGTNWINDITTFTNKAGVSKGESSGYTFNATMGRNRLLQVGDTGINWSYAAAHPSPNPFTVWGKFIDMVPANINRIDLKTKFALGLISVSTDMTYTNLIHPEARPAGAFDGSTDYWSGAFRSAANGSFTITLDKLYRISALGICLQYNTPESASIYFSQDGINWGTPVKAFNNATHYAINYTSFASPILAKYVRVNMSAGVLSTCLNEIELYETSDTFENNAVGVDTNPHGPIPPGYTASGTSSSLYGFAVTEGTTNGYQSERALQMWDNSNTWIAGIKKTVASTITKSLRFRIKPLSGGVLFNLQADVTSGTTAAYHFLIQQNGGLGYYNGTAWQNLPSAPAGTVPTNIWSSIRVDAAVSPNNAAIYVNDVWKGNATMYANPSNVVALNGFSFASSGTANVGDKALFDDVSITELDPPLITSAVLSGSNVVIRGTNGIGNGSYSLVSSTNLSLPLSSWPVIATNQFDAYGGLVFTNLLIDETPRFYRLRIP